MANTANTIGASFSNAIQNTLPLPSIREELATLQAPSQISQASLIGEKLSNSRVGATVDPLFNQQPEAVTGFPNEQKTFGVLILIDAMLAIYQKSSTQASNSLLTVANNENSQLESDLTDLLNSSETQQTIQNQISQMESSDWMKYAMQAIGVVLAFSLGCLLAGPAGGVIAAGIAIGMDVMEDTGAWDDICNGIDNALGLTGKAADAMNAAIKIGTAVLVGLAAGGVTSLVSAGTAVADAALEETEELGGKALSKGVKAVGKGAGEDLEEGLGSELGSGASLVSDSLLTSLNDEVAEDVQAIEELGDTARQATNGSKKKAGNIVRESAKEAISEASGITDEAPTSVKGKIKGALKSAWKLVPKLSPRAAMTLHTGIQVFNGFKTEDGSDGQEMNAIGDIMLALGASDGAAEGVQAGSTLVLDLVDMTGTLKAASDAPGITSSLMASVTKWASIAGGVGEATVSSISGIQNIRLAKVLKELAPITEQTDLLSGETKEITMEIQQTQQAFQTVLQAENSWTQTTGELLNQIFSSLNTMIQG